MRLLRKIFLVIGLQALIIIILFEQNLVNVNAKTKNQTEGIIKVGVVFYDNSDAFISLVHQEFETIQNYNQAKVKFSFYDGKNDETLQNDIIDNLLIEKGINLLMLNLVNPDSARTVIDKIKEYNIPVILFNREPKNMNDIMGYNKAYYVGADEEQGGRMEGSIIAKLWNSNKDVIDRNQDNKLQYIMLMGQSSSKVSIVRSKYSIYEINSAGINTDELANIVCNWKRNEARQNFSLLLLKYINKVEAVISNNDEMAIGAIEALQYFGYNRGENSKTIPVVGIDAIAAAQELIKKDEMAGSVFQSPREIAEACFEMAMNLANGKPPLFGTNYKFDSSGVAVRIPFVLFNIS